MFTKYKNLKEKNRAKSARREAKKRVLQAKIEKEKIKPPIPVFQIGEQIAWKGVWFRVVAIAGENITLKSSGWTTNYLLRGGEKELYAKGNDRDSEGTDSKKVEPDTSEDRVEETVSKVAEVSDGEADRDGPTKVVSGDGE